MEQSSDRAAVLRFNEDGSGKRVYASGLRNAVGLAVEPTTGALWASQNERDNLPPDHEDLPPEEINILTDGGDYGWPYCYGDRVPNPEYNDAARCARTIPPAAKLQAHSAPLGMSFLARATRLPADYRSDLLVAYHGSWNRDTPTGAKVVRVRVSGGKPGAVEDFITGWQRRGRQPLGTAGGRRSWRRDGAVLISDDTGGAIYRRRAERASDRAPAAARGARLRALIGVPRRARSRRSAVAHRVDVSAGHRRPRLRRPRSSFPTRGSFLRGDVTVTARRAPVACRGCASISSTR